MSDTYGYVYETINLKNGKTYIGQHKGHWNENYFGSGVFLNKAIKKYGKDNFECNLIMWAHSRNELNNLEIKYIAYYKPEYNIAIGGYGGTYQRTKKTRQKQSEASRGEKNHFYGEHHLEETRKKISESLKGKICSEETRKKMSDFHKGRKLSEETKRKISEANKGKKLSKEHKQKISKSMKGRIVTEETKRRMSEAKKRNK
jgi:group I intron endonuclease